MNTNKCVLLNITCISFTDYLRLSVDFNCAARSAVQCVQPVSSCIVCAAGEQLYSVCSRWAAVQCVQPMCSYTVCTANVQLYNMRSQCAAVHYVQPMCSCTVCAAYVQLPWSVPARQNVCSALRSGSTLSASCCMFVRIW